MTTRDPTGGRALGPGEPPAIRRNKSARYDYEKWWVWRSTGKPTEEADSSASNNTQSGVQTRGTTNMRGLGPPSTWRRGGGTRKTNQKSASWGKEHTKLMSTEPNPRRRGPHKSAHGCTPRGPTSHLKTSRDYGGAPHWRQQGRWGSAARRARRRHPVPPARQRTAAAARRARPSPGRTLS
jgi:hypothetical protein